MASLGPVRSSDQARHVVRLGRLQQQQRTGSEHRGTGLSDRRRALQVACSLTRVHPLVVVVVRLALPGLSALWCRGSRAQHAVTFPGSTWLASTCESSHAAHLAYLPAGCVHSNQSPRPARPRASPPRRRPLEPVPRSPPRAVPRGQPHRGHRAPHSALDETERSEEGKGRARSAWAGSRVGPGRGEAVCWARGAGATARSSPRIAATGPSTSWSLRTYLSLFASSRRGRRAAPHLCATERRGRRALRRSLCQVYRFGLKLTVRGAGRRCFTE